MAGQPGDDTTDADTDSIEAGSDDGTDSITVSGPVAAWIRDRASAVGIEPQAYLDRTITALRTAESEAEIGDLASEEDLAALRERVRALDEEQDTNIQDVRNRIIQVKREVDGKARADHDHPKLREDATAGLEQARRASQRAVALEETVDQMETRLERGFENYEEILQYLVDRTDDLTADANSLKGGAKALERHLQVLRTREQRRQRTDALKEAANRKGVAEARCESCGSDVTVGLLTEPACPVCNADVAGVTPKQGFFGTATLDTGTPPALEESDESTTGDLAGLADEGALTDATEPSGGTDPTAVLDEDGSLIDVEPEDEPSTERPPGDADE